MIRESIFSRVRLAGAVAADDAEDLAGLDLEGDVVDGADRVGGVAVAAGGAEAVEVAEVAHRGRQRGGQGADEGVVAPLGLADAVDLGQVLDDDGGLGHGSSAGGRVAGQATSAKYCSMRRK